jgi:hypothetical protein
LGLAVGNSVEEVIRSVGNIVEESKESESEKKVTANVNSEIARSEDKKRAGWRENERERMRENERENGRE